MNATKGAYEKPPAMPGAFHMLLLFPPNFHHQMHQTTHQI